MTRICTFRTLAAACALVAAGSAMAANYSFSGNFSQDDDVQLFNFTADGTSIVTLASYGYGGGTQNNGNVVSRGGFDTVVTIFNAAGEFIVDNDDADDLVNGVACSVLGNINPDPITTNLYDACLTASLVAGDYIVAITQWDSFSMGPSLSNGFSHSGQGNFTGGYCTNGRFCDDQGNNRSDAWAFDILQVEQAQRVTLQAPVAEPGSVFLAGLALCGLAISRRTRGPIARN